MEARDFKCPGSSCVLFNVALEDDAPPVVLVVDTSTFCDASADEDVRLAISGHLLARQSPLWALLSQIHTYVLPLADHCTDTPRKGPSAGVYT